MSKKTSFSTDVLSIKDFAKYLKLSYSNHNAEEFLKEHMELNTELNKFYVELLKNESEARLENSKQNKLRAANFPYRKYLTDLEEEFLPKDAQTKLTTLHTLEFIRNGQNLILAGNPGTGKTHIAIGLGIKACMEGCKVLFCSIPNLINRLKEAKSNRTLLAIQRQFENYDLIILDELGYISFDKEGR